MKNLCFRNARVLAMQMRADGTHSNLELHLRNNNECIWKKLHIRKVHYAQTENRCIKKRFFTCDNNANSNCICKFAKEKRSREHMPAELLNKMLRFIFAMSVCRLCNFRTRKIAGFREKCAENGRRRCASFHTPSATFEFSICFCEIWWRLCLYTFIIRLITYAFFIVEINKWFIFIIIHKIKYVSKSFLSLFCSKIKFYMKYSSSHSEIIDQNVSFFLYIYNKNTFQYKHLKILRNLFWN